MKTYFKHYFILLIAAATLLVGCDKSGTTPENEPTEVSKDNSISNFTFQKALNPGFDANYFAQTDVSKNIIYITVPEGVSLKSLIPSITVHPKATIKSGTTIVESGKTSLDFSKTVILSITSESGSTRNYDILVKNGNTKVDNMVYSFMIEHNIPGVSVSVSKDEEIVYSSAYGYANTESKERVTTDHMFRLASMSKQHTAIAIMTLMEQGKLKLSDTVFGKDGLLYESFGDDMTSNWKDITVEHLLSHTSGIYTEAFFGAGSAYSGKTQNERIATLLKQGTIKWKPGSTYEYNNSNFGILGKIVEDLSGKPFMQFLKEDVYTPNGITGIDCGENDGPIKGEVMHYSQNSVNPYDNNVEAGVAAGGVVATAPGLMQLMARIDYGTKVPDILKPETLDLMYQSIDVVDEDGDRFDQYGLGWRMNYTNYPTWEAFHGGTLAGVCPIWARSSDNVNGVILCNSRSYDQSIDSKMWHMLEDIQDLYR